MLTVLIFMGAYYHNFKVCHYLKNCWVKGHVHVTMACIKMVRSNKQMYYIHLGTSWCLKAGRLLSLKTNCAQYHYKPHLLFIMDIEKSCFLQNHETKFGMENLGLRVSKDSSLLFYK